MENKEQTALQPTEPKILSAEDIFAAQDIETVPIDVPEWGGQVLFKMMTGLEAQEFNDRMAGQARKNALAILVIQSAVNAKGDRLFTDAQIPAILKKSTKVLVRLQKEFLRLNGMTPEQDKAIKND